MKKIFLFSIVYVLCAYSVTALTNEVNIGDTYSSVKIRYNNGEYIKAKDFILVNDSTITFLNSESNAQTNMNASKINYVSIVNGSYAGEYALYGGLLGLSSTLYAWAETSSQYGDVPFETVAPIMVGFTLGLGAIGALVGACNLKYKRLYLPTKSNSYNYYITPNLNSQFVGVSLVCQIK